MFILTIVSYYLGDFFMRAEALNHITAIKQALALLRRFL